MLIRASPATRPVTDVPVVDAGELDLARTDPAPLPTSDVSAARSRDPCVHVGNDWRAEGRDALAGEHPVERGADGDGLFVRSCRRHARLGAVHTDGGLGVAVLPDVVRRRDGRRATISRRRRRCSTRSNASASRCCSPTPTCSQRWRSRPAGSDADLSSVRTGVVGGDLVPEGCCSATWIGGAAAPRIRPDGGESGRLARGRSGHRRPDGLRREAVAHS